MAVLCKHTGGLAAYVTPENAEVVSMNHAIARRRFLAASGSLVAGLSLGSRGWAASDADAAVKWPVGCRDTMLRHVGSSDCWSAMQAVGAECLELDIDDELRLPALFHPEQKYSVATPEAIARLSDDLKAVRGRATALCMHNRFDERPEFEVEWTTRAAYAAKSLGAPAIRIDIVPRKLKAAELLEMIVPLLKRILAATETTEVKLAIENHGQTTNNPDFLRQLFDRVGSDRLGLTLDTGNFYWFGHPLSKLYDIYTEFAPRAFHTHCKSINYPAERREAGRPMGWEYGKYTCAIHKGDIDFRRVVEILRGAGYQNDLCIENESLMALPEADRAKTLAEEIRFLKELR
jgi:sugar phosphate isomerase/epimerase